MGTGDLSFLTGDSIPMHLLTNECFKIYAGHLKEDGILAYHITSRYVDLLPVISALAERHGYTLVIIEAEGDDSGHSFSRWALVTTNQKFLKNKNLTDNESDEGDVRNVLWTDDFSSLFDVLE